MTQDKVAIITAGGSGMGAGAARKLAAEGYKVAILSSSGKGEALAEELGGFGVTGSNLNPDDLSKLVNGVIEKWGRIDVVVNSAGHGPKGDILEMTDEDWTKGMEVYLLNVIRIARLVTPVMLKQGSGSIVNISTYACFEPEALFPTSGVFRSGLAAFVKLFSDQYAAKGIRINNILPGFIDSLPEKDERRNRIPMKRYGKVEEIAEAIYFLASGKSSYITGQNLRVDGGITRSV
ncbi:SDR family oxidoreductase [Maridesulfovibrio hydrothermalis]|uniref:3-oxoacyl-[acyl-carrier-protein] reductase n=1 Tax=Maridesulfovibrio hydrothermalis AM13 = DSM 14728 TaxID=1121451 RepID=L0RDC9_9BACT|nr:SDR family oxidoreductase [Maridesulfovibrio hydrothermalis]CCO24227.1 3-oxoacyl-[acyl-carrier-protein] reductase [Maridesulfovibrio hydrothermalis AM13 = DSM 14728]